MNKITKILSIAICSICLVTVSGCRCSSNKPLTPEEIAAKQQSLESTEAVFAAQTFVQNSLKCPTTAKFPTFMDILVAPENPRNRKPRPGVWVVWSHVDSQNSFGAMVRSNWQVELKKVGDKWIALKIDIW